MTDLIKRLRSGEHWPKTAADRIEELERYCAAYAKADRMAVDHINTIEVKLAKAMTGLRKIADHKHFVAHLGWTQNAEARIASATLAELEGGE